MNRTFFLHFFIFLCLILCGCITEWEAKDIDEIEGILVVEGFITDDESVITLSRSKGITYDDSDRDMTPYRVADAKVSIECDDGTQWAAAGQNLGEYTVETGKLNPEQQYRLKIEFEGHEYQSEYACPMVTPEIDSVFWTKQGKGYPVNIHVATHAPDSMVQYYRWSYREEWEFTAQFLWEFGNCPICDLVGIPIDVEFCPACGARLRYPYYCWKRANSREILAGTSEKTVSGKVTEIIAEIPPSNDRFSVLYRMDVTQHAISKRAYDYYTNVKKNAQQTGSLFAHIPSELKGNITCITDPARPVIGYVDISSVTQKRLYVYSSHVYEKYGTASVTSECEPTIFLSLELVPNNYVLYPVRLYIYGRWGFYYYIAPTCADCQLNGGKPIEELPDDWPYYYYIYNTRILKPNTSEDRD